MYMARASVGEHTHPHKRTKTYMYISSAAINHSLQTPSMKNETFHGCQRFRTHLHILAAYITAKRWRGGRQRRQREVVEEPDTKGHLLSAQQRLPASSLWPGKRKRQEQTWGKLRPLQQLPVSQAWQLTGSFLSVPHRVSRRLKTPLHFSSLTFHSSMWGNVSYLLLAKPPPPPFTSALSVHLSHLTGKGPGLWSRKQTGVQVCDVWHAHAAWDHHREETGLTAASPWPWLHYLLARCWRSRERPACTTAHLRDLDTKATQMKSTKRQSYILTELNSML